MPYRALCNGIYPVVLRSSCSPPIEGEGFTTYLSLADQPHAKGPVAITGQLKDHPGRTCVATMLRTLRGERAW